MAFSNGNLFTFQLDVTAGGVLTDMSQYISNVELESERDTNKLARGGGFAKASLVAGVEHSGTIDFWYDPVIVNCLRSHMDQTTTVVSATMTWRPQGTGAGLPERTAEVFLSNLSEQTNADDPAQGSCDFEIDGAITTTAQA